MRTYVRPGNAQPLPHRRRLSRQDYTRSNMRCFPLRIGSWRRPDCGRTGADRGCAVGGSQPTTSSALVVSFGTALQTLSKRSHDAFDYFYVFDREPV